MLTDATAVVGSAESHKRRQILDGARQVFLSSGFDGASMGEIARAAGVSKGTLYVYFDSKEVLFEALTRQERESLAEALFQLDEADPDVRAGLRRLGLSFLDHLAEPDHVASVRMVMSAVEKFPRVGRAFYEAGPLQGSQRLRGYLDSQVTAGRLAIADTTLAAYHFLELVKGGLLVRLLFGVDATVTQAEKTYAVEEALRVFFAAYGPRA